MYPNIQQCKYKTYCSKNIHNKGKGGSVEKDDMRVYLL